MPAPAALAAIAPASAMLLADAVSGGNVEILNLIGSVGFPATIVVAIIAGWLVPGRAHDRVVKDRDDERAERQRLQATVERVLPALTRQTIVMEEALPILEERVRIRGLRNRDDEPDGGE